MFVCKECLQHACAEEGDDNFDTGLCHRCFEAGLEEHEERKRQRIAERNEY